MVRALHALQSGETFGLGYVSEPMNYKEARNSPHWPEWKKSMEHEIASHIENGTWKLVKLLEGRAAITGRWVFKIKYGVDSVILRFKTHWVVHGYKQKEGLDYTKTWARVVKSASFRTLFAIVAERRLHAEQMDIVTAFLYDFLEELVYVTQPEGFIANPGLVCQLIKALYGLKQSPRVWYGIIKEFLKSLGFNPTASDDCVYVSKNKKMYVAIYVDNLLIIGADMEIIKHIKKKLGERFKMTDLGAAQHYLGIEIIKSEGPTGPILLRQTTFLTKVLERFNMHKCKVSDTPMEPGLLNTLMPAKAGQKAHPDTVYWYGSAVGSLMYAAVMTRPDIAFALSVVNRYCSNPDFTHVAALLRIFRYIQGSLHYGLGYEPGQDHFHGFTDSNYAGAVDGRCSTGGYVFFIAGGAVSWSSKRQTSPKLTDLIALSSCEAEYYALVEAAKEGLWLRRLLMELGYTTTSEGALVWVDNQGAIALSENPKFHRRTKHIDVRYHWIRNEVTEERLQLEYIPTGLMAADGLTKPLGTQLFRRFLTLIRMAL